MPEPTELQCLAGDHVSGCLDADGQRRLADALEADPAARRALADQFIVDRMLRQAGAAGIDIERIMRAVPLGERGAIQNRVLHLIESDAVPAYRAPRPGWHWPLAAAAVLLITCSLALVVGTARHVAPVTVIAVATLRSGHDAVWSDGHPPTSSGSDRIIGTKLDLRAGLAAIALPSGAELVIEGPTVIELTGSNQARLLLGRASAHVPPRASGFTLVAEGITVVDRGTAFGIDQGVDGCAQLHVFAGAVEANARAEPTPVQVRAGSAVRLDARGGGTLAPIPCEPTRFARSLRPVDLALDLVDLTAGGDGRGSAVADGIDPTTGDVLSSPAIGVVHGDGNYHRVTQASVIDGVFVPLGDREQAITSAGHRYRFPPNDGQGYDLIRRGGTFDVPGNGGRPEHPGIPPIFDGVDFRTPGHAALGLHANCGFTIDLAELAAIHPGLRVERFTASVANIGRKNNGKGRADFWIMADGVMASHYFTMTPDTGTEHVDLRINPGTRFLTLVSTDSGDRSGLDWITLGDPRLHLGSAP